MRYLVVLFLVVTAFSAGAVMGWDSGVRDAQNLITSSDGQ